MQENIEHTTGLPLNITLSEFPRIFRKDFGHSKVFGQNFRIFANISPHEDFIEDFEPIT